MQYNEVTPKKTVVIDGDPYLVLSSNIAKKDRQKASNQTRLKNLKTGNVIDRTFHQSDSLHEADVSKKTLLYLYNNRGEYWFCEVNDRSARFSLREDMLDGSRIWLRENSEVEALVFNDEIIGVTVPIKIDLKVVEAAPAVKGSTSSGATKEVRVESGTVLQVPMFINEGDVIRINTETGAYTERVEKA